MAVHGMPARAAERAGAFAEPQTPRGKLLPATLARGTGTDGIASSPERIFASDAGQTEGPARGLILGLAIGVVMWTALIAFFWFMFHRI